MQVVQIGPKKVTPQGKRAQLKAQNRSTILEAARRVFAELGFGAAGVRDIIRATPLAAGTFYNYFRSKEEVFQALCVEAAQTAGPMMRDARQKAKSAEAFFLATFKPFFAFVAERRAGGIGPDFLHNHPAILGLDELQQDIAHAVARGILPPLNAKLLASAMSGLASGLAETFPEWCSAEQTAQFATRFMLSGFPALTVENKPVAVNC